MVFLAERTVGFLEFAFGGIFIYTEELSRWSMDAFQEVGSIYVLCNSLRRR